MQLNETHVKALRDDLRSNPLKDNEIRRVEKLGEQYIALSSAEVDEVMYTEMYVLSVDKVHYQVYSKTGVSPHVTAVA